MRRMCNVAFLTDRVVERKILLNAFEESEKSAVVSYQIKCDIATTEKFFLPQMWTREKNFFSSCDVFTA